jgi:hypothetical protein
MKPAPVLRLAVSNPICTHEELAALEFEPFAQFVNFAKNPQAMEEHEEKLKTISVMSRFAIAMLGKTKAEMIQSILDFDEDADEEASSMAFLEYMTRARGNLEALFEFVTAAEIRHACAMANVYSDEERAPPIPEPPVTAPRRKR